MNECITGIQQVGIGVTDANEAKHLYKDLFGMDVLIFEDIAPASLMKQYTGNTLHERHAILSLNMSGGGGFEMWQYTSRKPLQPALAAQLGHLGIFAVKIKSQDVTIAHAHFNTVNGIIVSDVMIAPDGRPHFWITDKYSNHFNIVEANDWFKKDKGVCGGVVGAVIGVGDMDKAIHFYKEMLGINEVVYNCKTSRVDTPATDTPGKKVHQVLLQKQVSESGAFSKLLGSIQIELIQLKETAPQKIYANRYWGDCGFIHLCFDVLHMDELKNSAAKAGYPFSVDSNNSFTMGSSAGRFCYVEDPDGTLIELVETHKVPIFKKLGWYINLKKRKGDKPLPDWMVNMLALNKIR